MAQYTESSVPRAGKGGKASVTATSAATAIPSDSPHITFVNDSTTAYAYMMTGISTIVAVKIIDNPIPPKASRTFSVPPSHTHFALVCDTGETATVTYDGVQLS